MKESLLEFFVVNFLVSFTILINIDNENLFFKLVFYLKYDFFIIIWYYVLLKVRYFIGENKSHP